MDGPGRACPYEDDITLPMYDYENLYLELVDAVRRQDNEAVKQHIIKSNNLIEMEELPMYLTIKYCVVVAALLIPSDWKFAQVC
jgi:hypothetical protein